MANVVIPTGVNNLAVPPSADLMQKLARNYAGAFADFSGAFRSISLSGRAFTLKDGSSTQTLPGTTLDVIVLGIGHDNHCIYYKNSYRPGQEPTRPDAVWYQKNECPDIVPAAARTKDATGFYGYKIARRLVVALMQKRPNDGTEYADLVNPYVLDVGSMSIFGADYPAQMAFSLSGYMRLCTRQRIMPCQFVTQLRFIDGGSTSVLRFAPRSIDGQIQFFDNETQLQVYFEAASDTIVDMLRVNEIPSKAQQLDAATQIFNQQQMAESVRQQEAAQLETQRQSVQQGQGLAAPNTELDNILSQAQAAAVAANATLQQQPVAQPQQVTPPPVQTPQMPVRGSEVEMASNSALESILAAAGSYGSTK